MYKSVLILEDDEATASLIKHFIEPEGFVVFIAENGREAFKKLEILTENHSPCLILCDLQMPIMSGWEFVEKYDRKHKAVTIPIVIHSSDDITPPGYRALHKPVDCISLLAMIKAHCGDGHKQIKSTVNKPENK